ncbi:MAG: hypothetical protein R2766_03070 [Saprospiraceae bacterium]
MENNRRWTVNMFSSSYVMSDDNDLIDQSISNNTHEETVELSIFPIELQKIN